MSLLFVMDWIDTFILWGCFHMTNKEELIKAAETLEKYCDEHKNNQCMLKGCPLRILCSTLREFRAYNNVSFAMKYIIGNERHSDD